MSIPEIKNILHTKFARDTKIDYKTENRAVSIWFEQWDTDKSGDFNDAEWEKYQADVKKAEERQAEIEKISINKDTVSAYDKVLVAIEEQYQALEEKFNTIDNSAWEKLLEFEEKHPAIDRCGLSNNETLPEGAYEFDISAIEVGIYDKENDCFTGECYKKGYITGLNELSESERNEYLQLLESSINSANNLKQYVDEYTKLEQEFDKYNALKDMAETGVISDLPTADEENKLYSKYVNIRSNANPFYNEIKEIEKKMTTLRLKGTKTDDDLKQIEQYRIQLNQLYEASRQWKLSDCDERPSLDEKIPEEMPSLSDCDEKPSLNEEIPKEMPSKPNLQVTDLSGSISYQDGSVSQETSIGVSWNPNEAVHVDANASNTARFSGEDKKITNETTANLEAGYNSGDISVTSTSNVNHSSEMTNYTQTISTEYKNISAKVVETINSTEGGTVNSTEASLEWKAGKHSVKGSTELTESGNTYSLSSAANYNISIGSGASLKLSPEIQGSFNDATQDWMLAPTMNLYSEIKGNNVKAVLNASESHVTTFGKESITTNHNFTATGNIEVKKWSFGAKINDSDTSDSHSNTYGVNASYSIDNVGTISAEASHQVSRTKGSGERNNSTMFMLSFKAPFEAIGKLFSWI